MTSVCIYLQVHQPYRVKRYRAFDIGKDGNYFNGSADEDPNNPDNRRIFNKVAEKSYLPTNKILLELLEQYPDFKFALSLSGVAIDQMKEYNPEVLESFKRMVDTGRVELLSETYNHSLAFWYSRDEFEEQVAEHGQMIIDTFGVVPQVFRNTELAYSNELAHWAEEKGYRGILCEGWEPVMGWRSPNFVYRPAGAKNIKLLTKNYKLSDDVAFRFSEESWEGWPLTADKFARWVSSANGNGDTVNLFMDYETFGDHQWEHSGIFNFLRAFPEEILKHPDNDFKTPSEVVASYEPQDEIDIPHILTWADTERDLTAWLGNDMQHEAINAIYGLEDRVKQLADPVIVDDWKKLQTSDHFYYMCTKYFADGDVHAYFSPYESPYEAFIAYMNAIKDLTMRIDAHQQLIT